MRESIQKQISRRGFSAAVIILLALGSLLVWRSIQFAAVFKLTNRTDQIVSNLYETDSLLDNANMAVRTFILDPQENNLAAWKTAEVWIPVKHKEFENLSAGDPYLQSLNEKYEQLINRQFALFQSIVDHRRRGGLNEARRIMDDGHATELDGQNNDMIRFLMRSARARLHNRQQQEKSTIRNTLLAILLGGGFSLLLLMLVYRRLREELLYRERATAALIQSEKLAGIGQFAAGVAHDVNNPIGVILGFSQAIIRRMTEADVLMIPMQSIEREALRCKTLVQNLLAFSRGKVEAKKAFWDLNKVVDGALALVATLAPVKNVSLVRSPHEDIPPVLVNDNEIQQAVINLCTNAIDAMPGGGTLTVGVTSRENHVEISVQDSGSGISPEVRKRMFDAFFTTKEVGRGTGLGLSIITGIVKAHQGKIDVQSVMGEGTTFTLQLPLSSPAVLQEPALTV